MHRIDTDGSVAGRFDDSTPDQETLVDASIMNAIQEEIANTVESDGTTLDTGLETQLLNSLAQILATPGGRLTLTTVVPVTTADVAGATTVRYTPFKHSRISIYNGTWWKFHSFAELSQATTDNTKSPAAVANNSNYDIFVWNDGGTLRATRGPAWTSDTGRGTGAGTTELELFTGRMVNKVAITNGPTARGGTYVGTVRSDGSAQINDSAALRHVWNAYNRVERPMLVTEATDTWTYTTATYRQARATATNQLSYVVGLSEDPVEAEVSANVQSDSVGTTVGVGVGVDSTSANSAQIIASIDTPVAATSVVARAAYRGFPGIGKHLLVWLEKSEAAGTTTWEGDGGIPTDRQSGIRGSVLG